MSLPACGFQGSRRPRQGSRLGCEAGSLVAGAGCVRQGSTLGCSGALPDVAGPACGRQSSCRAGHSQQLHTQG